MEHSLAVISLLTDDSLPTLRKLVKNSPNSAFHWGPEAAPGLPLRTAMVSPISRTSREFQNPHMPSLLLQFANELYHLERDGAASAVKLSGAYCAAKAGVPPRFRYFAAVLPSGD